jgi:hypothetical protein
VPDQAWADVNYRKQQSPPTRDDCKARGDKRQTSQRSEDMKRNVAGVGVFGNEMITVETIKICVR